MWNDVPLDLLSHIFSYLPPDSLLLAKSLCKHWYLASLPTSTSGHHPRWFLAVPSRGRATVCYAHNPSTYRWYSLPLTFLPHPIRLLSAVGSLLLCKLAASQTLRLVLFNPFTRHHVLLPDLLIHRSNPAVGIVVSAGDNNTHLCSSPYFKIYVAGGTSSSGYECMVEVYESWVGRWRWAGTMPAEYAVRLTVWTPNESVEAAGVVYWMTSARAYSVVAYSVGSGTWREVRAPMAERLEWAALVKGQNGRVKIAGGVGEGGWVWEMEGGGWREVAAVPEEMGRRFWGSGERWGSTKCVGDGEGVYMFRELGSETMVWKDGEWSVMEGCCASSSSLVGIPVRAALLQPSLAPTCMLCYTSETLM